jgi:PhnB protein
MQISPYLNFNGDCATAFAFYEKCLGGKITMMMSYADSPMKDQMPPDLHKNIINATLHVGDQILQGSDATPANYQKPQGFSVTLSPKDPADADRIFAALAENGTVRMPIQKTFWAERFGMVTDRFGIPWMVNCGNQG